MAIKTIEEFLVLGKEYSEKLPAAPVTISIQDTLLVYLYKELNQRIKWQKIFEASAKKRLETT